MEFLKLALYMLNFIFQLAMFVLGAYFFTVSLFGFIPRKESEALPGHHNTFALIVAAHNEEMVIEHMVDSLNGIQYPRECYDIFVVADNCTDKTAEIARNAGAIVFERSNTSKRGKGFALEWMFDKLFSMEKKYTAVAIFDADNIVAPKFLSEMNKQLNNGHKAVQGYIDSKNPVDSWISIAYSISFWSINRLFQLARYNLNLGCQLCGTGFIIQTDLLQKLGWGATCLTEDMEFTMKLCLNDIKVSWAQNAVVYDEKPLTLSQSWRQRVRWMQGHVDVASRYIVPLVKKAIRCKTFVPIDCVLYLLQPLRVIVMGYITLLGYYNIFFPDAMASSFSIASIFNSMPVIWQFIVVGQLLWLPFVLLVEKRLSTKVVFGYPGYLFYILTWIPIAVIGFIKRDNKEWFHTKHTRKIGIEEFEKVS